MAGEFHSPPLPNAEAFEDPMAYPCTEVITVQYGYKKITLQGISTKTAPQGRSRDSTC
jgi:hypothetical protein